MILGFSDEDRIIIGKNLREIRKAKDLKQSDVERLMPVGERKLTEYECGKKQMDIFTLEKFAKIYKVPLEHLLDGVESDHLQMIKDKASFTLYEQLPQPAKSMVTMEIVNFWNIYFPNKKIEDIEGVESLFYYDELLRKFTNNNS